jgi:hypothetical protein
MGIVGFVLFGMSTQKKEREETLNPFLFFFLASMTWIGLTNNEPAFGYPHTEIVYICVSIGLGLIGAAIFMFVFSLALYLVGGK